MPSRSFILLRLTEETRRSSPLLTMPGNRTGPGPAAPASRSTMRGGPSPAPVRQPRPRAPGFLPAKLVRSRSWVPASGSAHSCAPPASSFRASAVCCLGFQDSVNQQGKDRHSGPRGARVRSPVYLPAFASGAALDPWRRSWTFTRNLQGACAFLVLRGGRGCGLAPLELKNWFA